MKLKTCLLFLLLFIVVQCLIAQERIDSTISPKSIKKLRASIIKLLEKTKTPAAGIALVDSTGPVWVEGLGIANIEKKIRANNETMFRIGSTSKVFIALAVMKLQEEGKLSLEDRVRDLVPGIEFTNPWKDTHPILVSHLLEHTTGWDDLHLSEFTHNNQNLLTLKEGLDFHPHSRISKWIPGTRMAYCNSGPNVAAYIVEKITGMPFESYVKSTFFGPMEMETMTYFLSEDYKIKGATLYEGTQAMDYWHLITRPSGAINSSPEDMAKLVDFFIQRGKTDSTQLVSREALRRMETPSTTLGAKEGLRRGYGLGLYTSSYNGFTYYSHGGSVHGGTSDFSYLPDHKVGYSVQINSGSGIVLRKISDMIRDYQTQGLLNPKPQIMPAGTSQVLSGYYHVVNPRRMIPVNMPSFMAAKVWTGSNDTIYIQMPAYLGDIEKYIPISDRLYQSLDSSTPDLAIVNDPLAGHTLEVVTNGVITLDAVSGLWVFGKILVFVLWIGMVIRSFILFPFWAIRYRLGKIKGGSNIQVRIWPAIAPVFLIVAFLLAIITAKVDRALLAEPNVISISIMMATIAFFGVTCYSVFKLIKTKNEGIRLSVYLPASILSGLQLLVAFHLLYHGLIGIRLWL